MSEDTAVRYLKDRVAVYGGDCMGVVKALFDNSIDAVVTDPPYALVSITKRFGKDGAVPCKAGKTGAYQRASAGFMGKKWDTGETAFSVDFWREVLRVLKPGGHVAAFSGTRSYHQLAYAIESAGFEIRDQCKFDHDSSTEMTAFLNSLNNEQYAQFRKLNETDELGQLAWAYATGFPKSHDVSKGIDKAAGAERTEVIGTKIGRPGMAKDGSNQSFDSSINTYGSGGLLSADITAPATDAARKWEGWGTALKPAWEPICLARKPLSEPTVAANVLRWGTGAINIGACRVGYGVLRSTGNGTRDRDDGYGMQGGVIGGSALGRWPANIVIDDSQEVRDAFPDTAASPPVGSMGGGSNKHSIYGNFAGERQANGYGDSGSAARFFYSSKADSDDRLASRHPTIKPLALIQWLCKLICPPGGTILDCFAGTGTTGEAAWREGFNAVLIERELEYLDDIARRMKYAFGGLDERKHVITKAKGLVEAPGPLFVTLEGK